MMTVRSTRGVLVVVAAFALAGCARYQVHTDFDDEVEFRDFRTFAWMDSTRGPTDDAGNPFLERRVRRSVELVMQERGLRSDDAARADLLVTAFVIGPARGDRRSTGWSSFGCAPSITLWFGPRYPFGYSRRRSTWMFGRSYWANPWGFACAYRLGYGYGWFPLYDRPGRYLEGTLVVDILDRSSRELIWRGTAEGALIDPRDSDQPQEDIDRVVREILARFPPGA